MCNDNKNQPKELSSDELWVRAGAGQNATRAELGLPQEQINKSGTVSLNFELNHDKNNSNSGE